MEDVVFDDAAELAAAIMNAEKALRKALKIQPVARSPELVDTINSALKTLDNLPGDVSETKAKAIAEESRGYDLRRTRLRESGGESFGDIRAQMDTIKRRMEYAETLTGYDRILAFNSIDADQAAIDRQLERLADDIHLASCKPFGNRPTKLIERSDIEATKLDDFARSLR